MEEVPLYTSFAVGMSDYITRHNANYSMIKTYLEQLLGQVTGQSGGLAVPYGLAEILDRRGIIGKGSYDFSEGTLTGPSYNLAVAGGAYISGFRGTFYYSSGTVQLSMAGKSTGTYYVNLDGSGVPIISASADTTTTRQFSWDSVTHIVDDKALYTGVNILFDGDDYADMLTSAAKAKTFEKVADRFEELEEGQDMFGGYYAQDLPHSGLNFKYKGGKVRNDSDFYTTPDGQVALTDDLLNYIELDPTDGTISANTTGFTSGQIGLYTAVAASGAITTVVDYRTPAIAGTGGGGGHTQGTDQGTTYPEFVIDSDATGSPTGKAGIVVENGDDPNAKFEWDRDTGKWRWTDDGGTTWHDIDEGIVDLGVQALTQYIGKEDPDLVLEDLARDSSSDYEDIDFSSYVEAPLGVEAVALRVQFWDSAPGSSVKILFKKKGSFSSPPMAFTIWSDDDNLETIILPVDDDVIGQFFVFASGVGTANVRVWLQGYYKKVTGVGTQDRTFVKSGIIVAASGNTQTNAIDFLNRGLCHYLKVEETGGLVTGTYNIEIFAKDTFLAADLLYKAELINPAEDFEDWLPFWVNDADETSELHVKITNNDTGNQGTYTVTLKCEQFA